LKKLAIFASGSGSNAENIFHYFENNESMQTSMLISNHADAGVWDRFRRYDVEKIVISKKDLNDPAFLNRLQDIDLIVLAGFLLLIPAELIEKFSNRIINIHPALLPKYGGKGMYGDHVHRAVLANHEQEHGITIHLVNEEYDRGEILFQAKFEINEEDNLDTIKNKIHALEHEFYPRIIEQFMLGV
jgi:phosphoribosylglycinamide formyltransferase-1